MKSPLHLGEATNAVRQKYATAMPLCKEATTAMAQELKQPVYAAGI